MAVDRRDQEAECQLVAGMVGLAPNWVRLSPNGTNPGLFQIRFQCIWRPNLEPNLASLCLPATGHVLDKKKSGIGCFVLIMLCTLWQKFLVDVSMHK